MFYNSCQPMYEQRGKTLYKWGKDQTGEILYNFNKFGFRGPENANIPEIAFFGSAVIFGVGVREEQTLVSHFESAHNYGLAGNYGNRESVANLKSFVSSTLYTSAVKLIFFWIDRLDTESIPELHKDLNSLNLDILHISQGNKYNGMINLMPAIDQAPCGGQPGIQTHRLWANTIKKLLSQNVKKTNYS